LQQPLYDYFIKGGPVMWPLLLCSVLGLAFIIERALALLPEVLHDDEGEIYRALDEEGPEAAISLCETRPRAVPRVAMAGLLKWANGREEMREKMESVGRHEISRLERFLPILRTIGEVAPLLGFLGTVTGMIKAFHAVSIYGLGNVKHVADGIAEALITTATGLFIAVPVYLLFNYYLTWVDGLTGAMERIGAHIIERAPTGEDHREA